MSRCDPATATGSALLDTGSVSSQSSWTLPTRGEVDLWQIDLRQGAELPGALSEEEQRRVERLRSPLLAERLARSHLALRKVLSRYLACSPSELSFARGKNGKPELVGEDWRFNLSHSADAAALAVVRDARVGVDVERVDCERRFSRIGRRFFSEREYDSFRRLPPAELPLAFYRLWTRKEAYLKAWGTGLTFSSRRFSVALRPGGGRLLMETEMAGDSPRLWWFEERSFGAGYLVAACWEGGSRRLRRWSYRP